MKRVFLYYICLCASLVCACALASCDKNNELEPKYGNPGEEMERTMIVYMAGENTLVRYTAADSLEIAQGLSSIPEDARVVVFIDDTRSSRICVGTRTTPLQTVLTYEDNINSTDSASMLSVLDYIVRTYPARHYGMTFWSHASGWVTHPGAALAPRRSFGIDNGRRDPYTNDGREMNISTLARVLSHLPHMDYLFFDACFMQCVEVAYELRNVADWIIASPAEIPGDGAPYQYVVSPLCQAEADISGAVQAYYDYYNAGEGHRVYYGVVLSAVRTSHVEALADATRSLAQRLFAEPEELQLDSVQRYCLLDESDYYTEYYDMASLIYHNASVGEYEAWRAAFDDAVPYTGISDYWYSALVRPHAVPVNDHVHTGAVSIYTPGVRLNRDESVAEQWDEDYRSTAWYAALGLRN